MFHFFYFIHYYPIKNSDIVTDSSLCFVTFRMTMEFAKDKISINMSKLADSSLRSIKSIALNKSTKTKFFQRVINVRPHYSCVIFLLIRNENDPKHRLSIGLHRSLLGWAPTPPQGRQKR